MLHIPALRLGKPYTSLEKTQLVHHVTGEPVAEVSQLTGSAITPRPEQDARRPQGTGRLADELFD
jgi:hypothetical protein